MYELKAISTNTGQHAPVFDTNVSFVTKWEASRWAYEQSTNMYYYVVVKKDEYWWHEPLQLIGLGAIAYIAYLLYI